MKIISKYKDYYDYLTGVYGEDPLIVLDRTKYDLLPYLISNDTVIKLYIGGYLFEGYKQNDKYYWGEDIKQFGDFKKYISTYSYNNPNVDIKDLVYIKDSKLRYPYVLIKPVLDSKLINEKENCPILLEWSKDKYLKYPILSDFDIASFIPPEELYKIISDWLSLQRTKSENKIDNRTNLEKIQTNGFDKKTSFRGK